MSVRVTFDAEARRAMQRGRFVRLTLPEPIERGGVPTRSALVGKVAGTWRAYANICRHQAVPLDIAADSPMSDDGRHLLCHQHGALYRPGDGYCFSGPCAGQSLFALSISEDGDALVLG